MTFMKTLRVKQTEKKFIHLVVENVSEWILTIKEGNKSWKTNHVLRFLLCERIFSIERKTNNGMNAIKTGPTRRRKAAEKKLTAMFSVQWR